MANSNKAVPQRAMTESEKKEQIIRFLGQKREQYTTTILSSLLQGQKITDEETGNEAVDIAVAMADHLLETMFPVAEKEDK